VSRDRVDTIVFRMASDEAQDLADSPEGSGGLTTNYRTVSHTLIGDLTYEVDQRHAPRGLRTGFVAWST
jgi:hypothetical protein